MLLFRYSAVTSNGHRIHYDRDYARDQEGHDLVVHGPLLAIFLQDHNWCGQLFACSNSASVASPPVFVDAAFYVEAAAGAQKNELALWIRDAAGAQAMRASAVFS
ncbi:hypothetical protein [Bradyrhizobium archetypum]|uniref:Acyl-CoA dehydrogenase n=1 Tax=Bradyrhizobium archetypum TaxID=2721160 RepID=A0A7Y4M5Q7_9BRAD|nr:hypothetical protein [Bradyrhizobium archetypum]NOJ50819.1 hypothetical protein [Bradyrhizobium archetypum]